VRFASSTCFPTQPPSIVHAVQPPTAFVLGSFSMRQIRAVQVIMHKTADRDRSEGMLGQRCRHGQWHEAVSPSSERLAARRTWQGASMSLDSCSEESEMVYQDQRYG
jgi:hypothetical protein